MSHTPTCEADGHPEHATATVTRLESRAPSLLDPAPQRVAARAARVTSFVALPEVRWAALSLLAFLLALGAHAAGLPTAVEGVLLAVCYVSGGWEPARAGLQALREKTLDVDLLMIVAALVAAAIGQAIDGALLIVIFATSGALEAVATKRTQDSVRSLLDLAPQRATRLEPAGSQTLVDAATLVPGDVILVRPGERVGADGHVLDGASEVDQSSVTGEPLPVPRHPGDEVFAGTVNGTGALRVHVDRAAADTVVARIVALVEQASATKAKTQLFIERVEQRYSVGVVAATLALFLVPLAFGAALQPTLLRAMTFMIVASPCAVVLATMPPLLSAIANAGRHGVLVKSAVVMEQLGHTSVVAFDKTGTLTEGTPLLATVHPLRGAVLTGDQVLALAAAAERDSEHPLAAAVVHAAQQRGLPLVPAAGFRATPGVGVSAEVGGRTVTVERPTAHGGALEPDIADQVAAVEHAGSTAVLVSVDGTPVGVLALTDAVRPAAAATVALLRAITGTDPILITGDNHGAAHAIAARVGISEVHAELLPHQKVDVVHSLEHPQAHVAVVGDGINDAPALAAAGTGIAMGRQGADLTLQTADVVIVHDDLATLPALVALSRRARRVVTQNLTIAATVILVLVTIDFVGHLPLPLGVLGHEGSTVIVGLNGLRLLSRRAWRQAVSP